MLTRSISSHRAPLRYVGSLTALIVLAACGGGASTDAGLSVDAALDASEGTPPRVTILTSFDGASGPGYKDHPDLGGAVGPNHVVDFVGSAFIVRDKHTGAVLLEMTQDAFWQAAGVTTATLNDPRIVFDPLAGRWYAVTAGPYDFLAVSTDDDPTHPFRAVTLSTAVSGDLLARVGFDRNGVYVCSYGGTMDSICFAIPKADAAWTGSGGPSLANMTTFAGLAYELVPAIDLDASKPADAPEMVLTRQGAQNATDLPLTLVLQRITWSGTTASISAPQTITTPLSYTTPADVPQPGSGAPLIKGRENHRFFDVFASGDSLYAAQGTQVGTHVGFNWVQVRASDGVLLQASAVSDGASDFLFPSVACDAAGNLAIAFARVSTTELPSVYVATRFSTDAPGTLRAPFLLQPGTAPYACSTNPVGWGTYTSTMRDPSDPMVLWTFQQYGGSAVACEWSTRWVAFSMGP